MEWEENHKISVQLEWNLDEGNADITAKLNTPFPRMRFLSLFGTYSLLENEGVLVVCTADLKIVIKVLIFLLVGWD